MTTATRTDTQAPGRGPAVVIGLLYLALAVLAGSTILGPTAPALVVIVAGAFMIAVTSPRRGVLVTLVLLLLVPQPFSVAVGPVTTSLGRLLLWVTVVSSFARSRKGEHLRSRLDWPMVLVLASMALSTVVNLPYLAGFEVAGAIRKITLFGLDFFAFSGSSSASSGLGASSSRCMRTVTGVVGGNRRDRDDRVLHRQEHLPATRPTASRAPSATRSSSSLSRVATRRWDGDWWARDRHTRTAVPRSASFS